MSDSMKEMKVTAKKAVKTEDKCDIKSENIMRQEDNPKSMTKVISDDLIEGENKKSTDNKRTISKTNKKNNIWLDGIMGVVTGDALGVPVQFMSAEDIKNRPTGKVRDMEGGGIYDMPPGCWSDDGSMTLAMLDSIKQLGRIDAVDIMGRYFAWFFTGEYTPTGKTYDMGLTCSRGIRNFFIYGKDIYNCGRSQECDNGNGSLMRTMPVCLYYYEKQKNTKDDITDEAIENIHILSGVTHNHMRSKIACGLYYFMVKSILDNKNSKDMKLIDCLQKGISEGVRYYQNTKDKVVTEELKHYNKIMILKYFKETEADKIKYSGYVVDTLQAAIWCLINTDSYERCLLEIVNNGDDSDTVGAVGGGLAGLYYGYKSIPKRWLSKLKELEWLEEMCDL